MSTNLVFARKEVESIDMYVSNDGEITALSIAGLAKLCGIHETSLLKLLNNLAQDKTVPKSLESLRHKAFLALTYDIEGKGVEQNAKLVTSFASSRIIRYYAYESKAANETARNSFDKFAELGIDRWIKQCTGFVLEQPKTGKIEMTIEAMEALHSMVGQHIENAKIIREEIPGVGTLLSAYKEKTLVPDKLPNPFLLIEYLKTKQESVDKSTKSKFAQFLVGYYRGVSLARPEKLKYRDDVYIGNSNVYDHDKIPLLDSAWESFTKS